MCNCCRHTCIPGGHGSWLHVWRSPLWPWHVFPPHCGMGLVQVRTRVWVPPPHVAVHWLQSNQDDQYPSMGGQSCVLHALFSLLLPWQSSPPYCGLGYVQVRLRAWVPLPQLWEHPPHGCHCDHPPSTVQEWHKAFGNTMIASSCHTWRTLFVATSSYLHCISETVWCPIFVFC